MKKTFIKFSMLLILLGMSVNAAWAQKTSTIYLASLKAQTDPASTGSGQVKLTWLDITGKPMENSIAVGAQGLNPTNPVGPAETAQMVAGTMIAIEGTETAVEIGGSGSQIYMTSVVYFHAEAEPANGSYLADWTFTDPKITRMTSEMNPANPMGNGNDIPFRSPCFKVLPKIENSATYPSLEVYSVVANVTANPNNIYALFSKYLLSNPVATNAVLEANPNAEANLTVTVEINGDAASLDAADFATFTFTNNGSGEWEYDLDAALAAKEVVSAQKTRITIPVTYTYKNTGFGLKNTAMTISMAGESASTLNINLSVNALDPERPEAYWFDGKVEKKSGNLADMLNENISTYANPILKLNKPINNALTFSGKDFALDLNGNTTQAITISSGNVTVAYSKFGGEATSLAVNGGKAILNGGTFGSLTIGANGTVEQNGATISDDATNNGTLITTEGIINGGLTSYGTLIIEGGTFNGTNAVEVVRGTADVKKGTLNGASCGLLVSGGTVTTQKLAAITSDGSYSARQTGGTLNVMSGKFGKPLYGSINFTAGFFKNVGDTVGLSAGKTGMLVSAGVEYNEGYRYFLGTAESAVANGAGVCRIGNVSYAKLEDAIAYANNNPSVQNIVIFMTNNYTLPAGYYTLPANATIVVPMSDSQEKEVNMTAPRIIFNDVNNTTPYTSIQPTEFRRLTFASGVNMDMFGDIELTCSQYASNEAYTAQPVGPYGRLVMEENSHITLQSGSEFRAWGFVTGKGEMDARRGATVREMFQLGDWKGAFTSVEITGMAPDIVADHSDKRIFPVTQYFIQNIESPVKYHPGAVLSTSAAVSEGLLGMSVSMAAPDIAIVGVSGQHQAIFLMDQMADADNTWVRKWYDTENDIQVYDINSAAHIGSMVLDMGDINLLTYGTVPVRLNSAHFDLPLTSNFKIHLLSGSMDFQQNTSLLPGAVVEVDKEATVSVAMNNAEKTAYQAWVDGGKTGDEPVCYTGALYVYDAEDWDKYAYCNEYDGLNMNKSTAYTKTVRYTPSANNGDGGRPTVRDEQVCPPDAAINVHGTFTTATGFVYCSEHGANIFSSNEDAGTFIFNEDAEEAGTRTVHNVKGSGTFKDLTFYPAKLKNGVADPAFANTSTAEEGDAYCYTDNMWNIFKVAEDSCFMKDNYDTYYAKPQEYVAVANGTTPNADHTYSDADGAGRLFILMDGCQWWEVEKKDNLYHCIHPNNDTYYYWHEEEIVKPDLEDEETWVTIPGYWEEKRFTITWKNWDGTIIQTADAEGNPQDAYSVTYGTMAEFLGTNPTREKTIDYTYDFTGWTPALGPVTSDVTYTATFTQKPRMYTIIFQNEGGVEIERQFLTHNEVPVCENVPTKIGHTLVWSPAVAAVTRDATYTATWEENPPTEYEVTFYDYDGTTVLQQSDVAVGAMPEYTKDTPTGKATWATAQENKEFTYVFDRWSPEIEKVSATSIKSYTAVYVESPLEYTITFKNENNSVRETQKYHYGETPVCSTLPTKAATAQYTYKLRWEPQIQTVMADATYKAVFDATTNKYTVSLKSNPAGAATFTGAGTFDYGKNVNNVAVSYDSDLYEFLGWADLIGDAKKATTHSAFTLTEDITIVADFRYKGDDKVTITWKNWDGSDLGTSEPKVNAATTYTGATPTKPAEAAYTYTFDGWTDAQGNFYKNNQTPKATADATYIAHFTAVPVPNLTISNNNGAPTVLSEPVQYHDLVITSNGATYSGQLVGSNYLTLTGNAHFDLAINAQNHTWYAIAVPWQVNPTNGISVDGRTLTFGKDFDILYYDGSERAAGRAAWQYLELKDGDKTIQPGTLYMIGLMMDAPVVRFTKKDNAPLLTNTTSVTAYASSEETDANWNGIANPALFTAYVNAGATLGQVYNNDGSDSYSTINLSTTKLILGQPVFVQAAQFEESETTKTITVAYGGAYAAAPRRAKATETNEFEVRLSTYGAKYTDRLFVQADENKEQDRYTIGKDLVKMGVSTRVAQMWINRYDTKLCMNTFAPINGVAEYPLGIYTPKNGEYRLSLATTPDSEASIYLTYDGEAIWNLANGAYVADLEKGTNSHYGIRVTVKKAPEIATGIDEAVVDSKDAVATKVLIGNQVFIIRGEKVYSIDGQLVK